MRATIRNKKKFEGNFFTTVETGKEIPFPLGYTIKIEESYSQRQRNFLFAMLGDIANHLGYEKEEVKEMIKTMAEIPSIAETDTEGMNTLIDTTITFVKQHDIPLSKKTVYEMDAEKHIDMCMFKGVCMICGEKADKHHVDNVGMGRNRDKIEYTGKYLPLCRKHHTELHNGKEKFRSKYLLDEAYDKAFERNEE